MPSGFVSRQALPQHGRIAAATQPMDLPTPDLIRYQERIAGLVRNEWGWLVILLLIGAVCYNGMLALLNAHVMSVDRSEVVISEILLLSGAAFVIVMSGPRPGDGTPAAFFAFFILDALVVSILNNDFFVDMARNAAIIAAFTMVGARIDAARVNRCFTIVAIIVAAVLLLEMVSTPTYAAWFAPGDYFAKTRNIPTEKFDELGLFANALGFDSRFAIMTIMDHRACSIFLEQVSLANFAIVLVIFLGCNWTELTPQKRLFFTGLTGLILVTTNSRLAFGLILLAPIACLLTLRWNRYLPVLVMPSTLVIAGLVSMGSTNMTDNLPGRLNKTIEALASLDMGSIVGMSAFQAPRFADSGYAYVIYGSTIAGLVILWLYVSLIASQDKPKLLRCNLLVNLYVFCSLTVSGNSVFSMKTAALLWLLVGNVRGEALAESETQVPDQRWLDSARWRSRPRFPARLSPGG